MKLQGRERCMIQNDEEEEQLRQAKEKTEMEMTFKERERRWQHREETMATNRGPEWGDDIEADRGQEEYHKDRSRWWVP
ncbi:unnamed protein product [Rhizophagus irregularis]|nr:unnamed protein product [Rhizophagus irregularis]